MARATMAELIENLRGLTGSGPSDYTVGNSTYWTDDQIEAALDKYATIYDFEPLQFFPQRSGSTYVYQLYYTGITDWEGTCAITDNLGTAIAGSAFTFEAELGNVNFVADQLGSARMITGTAYNVNAAASWVWGKKAAHYAGAYDVSTDNHDLKRSQLVGQAKAMQQYYASMSMTSISVERQDSNASGE